MTLGDDTAETPIEPTYSGLFRLFEVVESQYIYDQGFGERRTSGSGTGRYHLKRL
jgi:hypothetical protein